MTPRRWTVSLLFTLLIAFNACAGTETSLWHSYTPPSGEVHHAFRLANFKRGIFFGSCGPSTRSLRWNYDVDLKGAGPRFTPEQIELKEETATGNVAVRIVSGEIVVDEAKKRVRIALKVLKGDAQEFIGNGSFRLREGS